MISPCLNQKGKSLKAIQLLIILAVICVNHPAVADVGNRGAWGDQGDGTFKNPVLPGDFSDPDVIRVGGDYYFITSTFQFSPGMAVLHSKDLVNWQYLSHCVADLTQLGPELNWDRMNRYNRGIYAGAIRFHAGKFWVYFTTMDEGVFMTTATNAAGPWSSVTRIWDKQGFDDPCPFWDDDGHAYLLLSTPGKQWWTHIYKMSSDGKIVDPASEKIIDDYQSSEGNKIYKINGTYYVFHNQVVPHGPRVGVMMRSANIFGPYEKKVILEDFPGRYDRQPNQGGLVQTEAGDWWFITQQGRGENGTYDGRPAHLLPVMWTNGWPVPGLIDRNGAGTILWSAKKPINGFPIQVPQSDDEFSTPTLAPQWEWNYQPRAGKWSLTEHPGWLRLHAFQPLRPGDFFKAGNTLTQRIMGCNGGEVLMKMDVAGMADGQTAGLCIFWKEFRTLGVVQENGIRRIELNNDGTNMIGSQLNSATTNVWFKAAIDDLGSSTFYWSMDGKRFTATGGNFKFGWGNYRGTRIGVYSYNNEAENGFVDVDFFHYTYSNPQNRKFENFASKK
jgi:beta-xylosidase